MIDPEIIGKRLLMLRKKSNMSRMEVAKLCAISKSAVSMYEIGKRIPKDDIKIKLAKCYNTTVEKIFIFNSHNKWLLINIMYSKSHDRYAL